MSDKLCYYYNVYGLEIESSIEIEEFIKIKNKPKQKESVKIIEGKMKETIKQSIAQGVRNNFSKDEIWFHVENIGTYYIAGGELIQVEPCENCDRKLLKVFIMCSCMGFIMIQRNKVAIHGGTIVIGDKSIIITGDRGAGKSTLTTALRLKGYKFLSDDVAATTVDGKPRIDYGFPYQKLCEDSMDKLGYDKEQCTSFMSDTQVKYMVPAHEEFVELSVPLGAICEIVASDVEEVEIEVIKGREKLMHLMKNLYRGEFLQYVGGIQGEYFKQCIAIAKEIDFYRIKRPQTEFTIEEQIRYIEKIVS